LFLIDLISLPASISCARNFPGYLFFRLADAMSYQRS
jgi:hypothetical protein